YSIDGILSFIQGGTNYVGYMRSPISIQAAPSRIKDSNVIQNFLFSVFLNSLITENIALIPTRVKRAIRIASFICITT
ncbi:hypothetical protein P7M79_30050, partial [Vibrio parahaemolyticus]|nr:hypothetical protein [Vibrio parahaemolyticus]